MAALVCGVTPRDAEAVDPGHSKPQVILVMALSGIAQAKGRVDRVTGHYTYLMSGAATPRTVTLQAKASDPVRAASHGRVGGLYANGLVTCAIVVGRDAWLAGPITDGNLGTEGIWFRVHDGAAGHGGGDWAVQGSNTLDYVLTFCLSKDPSMDQYAGASPITSGSLVVLDK